jgi:hypothetical protein
MFHDGTIGVIGMDALQNYDLLFDFVEPEVSRATRVYYKPRNEFEDRIIGRRRLDRQIGSVHYNNVPEGITLHLLEGSGLFALGINENTVITRINGKQTKDMHGPFVWGEPPIRFTILEDGEERTTILKKQRE